MMTVYMETLLIHLDLTQASPLRKVIFPLKIIHFLEILITLLVRIQSFLLVQDWKIMKQSILIHMESRSTLQIICLEVKSHLVAF